MASGIEQAKPGPSASSKGEEPKGSEKKPEEPEKKSESLIERVKRQDLDSYERSFLDCIVDTGKRPPFSIRNTSNQGTTDL